MIKRGGPTEYPSFPLRSASPAILSEGLPSLTQKKKGELPCLSAIGTSDWHNSFFEKPKKEHNA